MTACFVRLGTLLRAGRGLILAVPSVQGATRTANCASDPGWSAVNNRAGGNFYGRLVIATVCMFFTYHAVAEEVSSMESQAGLGVEYFGSPRFERAMGRGVVATPSVEALDKGSDWAARFTGLLTPPVAGEYKFRAEADTGVRLVLAGVTVIDGWGKSNARSVKTTLAKGEAVAFTLEYFFDRGQGGKTPSMRLFWTPPGGQEEPVAADVFSHTSSIPPIPTAPVTTTAPTVTTVKVATVASTPSDGGAPIVVEGDDQNRFNKNLPDGGLKPLVGVHNIQVFRAGRVLPDAANMEGWTYAHHQDLACWKGRLYAVWAMTPKDEDVPPYRVVYSTSTNGIQWSAPTDLFPRENAWACRFYFYRASNGRMLAFCAGKVSEGTVKEADKKVLLVREIASDHTLGPVFTLIMPLPGQPPFFAMSPDPDFVASCHEAIDNRPLLEQQDLGVFLGDRRMKWHENPPAFWGLPFGKALSFYHRQDGILVGLAKQGFVTISSDEAKSWSKPTIPPTLTAGSGKIWGQKTSDGRFALAYNPDPKRMTRYPLALVHGDDGRVFRDMRVVHGELPAQRYPGLHKNLGPQYMRGLAEWANDGHLPDQQAMWLIYSVSKEDIWVSRIPLPIKPDETTFPSDDFANLAPGGIVPGWNLYSPRWAPVTMVAEEGGRCLELRDGDPFDYARAVRVFPASANPRVEFRVKGSQTNALLEVELCDASGRRPVRVALAENGTIHAIGGNSRTDFGPYVPGAWVTVALAADLAAGTYTVQVQDGRPQRLAVAEKDVQIVERLSFRTGAWRGLEDVTGVAANLDVPPTQRAVFHVDRVSIR